MPNSLILPNRSVALTNKTQAHEPCCAPSQSPHTDTIFLADGPASIRTLLRSLLVGRQRHLIHVPRQLSTTHLIGRTIDFPTSVIIAEDDVTALVLAELYASTAVIARQLPNMDAA